MMKMIILAGFLVLIQEINGLTPELRDFFLKKHNDYRSQLALGKIKNNNGTYLPQASNLYELKYSLKVEKIAQGWADNCVIEHTIIDDTTNNLFAETPYKPFETMAETASNAWLNEVNKNGLLSLNFTLDVYDKNVGHWVECNWHDVREIGCGITNCPNGLGGNVKGQWTFVVCAYNPGGNYLNEYIYTPGTPCSHCNSYSNSKCNQTSGLCYIEEPLHSTIKPSEKSTKHIGKTSTKLIEKTPSTIHLIDKTTSSSTKSTTLQTSTSIIFTTLTTLSSTFTWSYSTSSTFDSESTAREEEYPTTTQIKNTTKTIKTEPTRVHSLPLTTPSTSSSIVPTSLLSLLALTLYF